MQENPFLLREEGSGNPRADVQIHTLGPGFVCDTESRGYATPGGRTPDKIVLDATNGFIPLWARGTTLRWRFQDRSLIHFSNPESAKNEIRRLFSEGLLKWVPAVPVKFTEDEDLWDFEIVVKQGDDCRPSGCVLASAFFPDAGRHEFVVYPKMFTQTRDEQIDTFIHEIGHIFGLRHFFANIHETKWPSEVFGTHSKFTIMNYGVLSELTPQDKNDLTLLYQQVWSGAITHINGTPIKLVKPYSSPYALEQILVIDQIRASLQSGFVNEVVQ